MTADVWQSVIVIECVDYITSISLGTQKSVSSMANCDDVYTYQSNLIGTTPCQYARPQCNCQDPIFQRSHRMFVIKLNANNFVTMNS